MLRCGEKREGWLFPSKRAAGGHLTTVAKQFREARRAAGLPEDLVPDCARHTFGTAVYEATGNLAMVMKVMGHTDARTAMHYQHRRSIPFAKPSTSATYVTVRKWCSEKRAQVVEGMEPTIGLEPMTCRLRIGCSTN